MADQHFQCHEKEPRDRGMFDFLGKKEEKPQTEMSMTDCNLACLSEPQEKKEVEKPTLVEELRRSHSSSSSSSDEGGGEKKKKKKGLKEKIKEKMARQGEEEVTEIPVDKCDNIVDAETTHPEEKKGILEKIKEKLPGQHKKGEEGATTIPPECAPVGHPSEAEEKKGILEKIKEKLPGYHKNAEEEKEEN
ncbi:hypothetical protein L1049_014833 [Liquidambar formosana]|uniref:Dehydrin n=1 Tax=Liquidambar formosana TaxID=63359 RepID=A0AAP0X229_LIQFO